MYDLKIPPPTPSFLVPYITAISEVGPRMSFKYGRPNNDER